MRRYLGVVEDVTAGTATTPAATPDRSLTADTETRWPASRPVPEAQDRYTAWLVEQYLAEQLDQHVDA